MTETEVKLKWKVVLVTPALAQKWLGKNAENNRGLSESTILAYAGDMAADRWPLNGESIKFTTGGARLVDGQHRLHAVIRSGASVLMCVVEGVDDPLAYRTIDIPRRKRASDHLQASGVKNARVVESALKLILAYRRTKGATINVRPDSSGPERQALYDVEGESISASVDLAMSHRRGFIGTGLVAFVHSVLKEVDSAAADEFVVALMDGSELPKSSPIFLLRERLQEAKTSLAGKRLGAQQVTYLVFRTWNAWRKKERISKLQLPRDSGGERSQIDLPEPR